MEEIADPSVACSVHCLWEIDLPAQAVIERKLRRHPPSILAVEEPSLLALSGVQTRAHEPIKTGHVTQKEGRKIQTARSAVRRVARVEVQNTGAVGVAWDAEVFRIADVRSEFDLVIALDPRPIIDELELLFAFRKRAVAAPDVQTVAEGSVAIELSPVPLKEEGGRTAGIRRPAIQTGDMKK